MIKITWTELLAADKTMFMIASPIIPFWSASFRYLFAVTNTVIFAMLAWLLLGPICEIPWTAVRPIPRALLSFVSGSDPKHSVASFVELSQDKLICGVRSD